MSAMTCPQCGASFECCPQPDQRCWCLDLPALPAQMLGKDASSCYCPACLRDKLASLSQAFGASTSSQAGEAGSLSVPLAEGVQPAQRRAT